MASNDRTRSGLTSVNASNVNTRYLNVNGVDCTHICTMSDQVGTLTAAEIQQLQNINANTISNAQWAYLSGSNQGIATTATPTFSTLSLTSTTDSSSTSDGSCHTAG